MTDREIKIPPAAPGGLTLELTLDLGMAHELPGKDRRALAEALCWDECFAYVAQRLAGEHMDHEGNYLDPSSVENATRAEFLKAVGEMLEASFVAQAVKDREENERLKGHLRGLYEMVSERSGAEVADSFFERAAVPHPNRL